MSTTLTDALEDQLIQVAEGLDRVEALLGLSPTAWVLDCGNAQSIDVEASPSDGRLTLSVGLGTVPESRATQIYAAFMAYNMLWRETGGVIAGAADGRASLIVHLPLDRMDAATLTIAVENLAQKATHWADYVRTGTLAPDAEPLDIETAIRV